MAKAYIDGVFPDEEYHRQKRLIEMELESLVVPQANAAEEAGKLIQDLPSLWTAATMPERRKLLLAMLDGVYVDAKEDKRIVGIKPKPPFRPVFQVATTKEGSGVEILKEPPVDPPEAPCLWWRRGRVELPSRRRSHRVATGLVVSLFSPHRPQSTESGKASRFFLWPPHIGVKAAAPQLLCAQSRPVRVRSG